MLNAASIEACIVDPSECDNVHWMAHTNSEATNKCCAPGYSKLLMSFRGANTFYTNYRHIYRHLKYEFAYMHHIMCLYL